MSVKMKRQKGEPPSGRRLRLSYFLLFVAVLYLIFIAFKFPALLEIASSLSKYDSNRVGLNSEDVKKGSVDLVHKDAFRRKLEDNHNLDVPLMPDKKWIEYKKLRTHPVSRFNHQKNTTNDLSELEKMADEAWVLGLKSWEDPDPDSDDVDIDQSSTLESKPESCPSWIEVSGKDLISQDHVMFLPCGLAAGSSITIVGTPHHAHQEYVPQLAKFRSGDPLVMVSQFNVELQGLKAVEGEAPPKILHLNPRLRGDWSHRPVIEHNTCYRMQWGRAHRCDGRPSLKDEDMLIDGHMRCEKWMHNDVVDPKEAKTSSWFKRFIGRKQKPELTWPFPFTEGKLFILTIRAGIEGYHFTVGGRHVTSFQYRTGFTLEDATGLAVQGNVDVHSIYVTSLPTTHPSFSPQRVLEMSPRWKTPALPRKPIRLFIGILSATNNFAERMAVRKSWMQSREIRTSDVAVRFFVALGHYKNAGLTGHRGLSWFLDMVLRQIEAISPEKSLYMGNLNLLHRPLRHGKWAVSYEEWPEAIYPPYANGPAYIISRDVATFIGNQHANQSLRLFKMEDVSMGMWVQQYNNTRRVQYSHNWKYCQYGCMEGYFTAHYQSPRQMLCLWVNLSRGRPRCCNFR